ncbi:MAG: (2Fe-2S)-binding protein [Pseudomonadota bacterium]
MYVCICNALKDKQIAAASDNARTVAEVFKRCGRRPQCGKCLPDVAQMIEDVRDQRASPVKIAAE